MLNPALHPSTFINKLKRMDTQQTQPIPTPEDFLAKRIIRFPEEGKMTHEAIKRNVIAAMEQYAIAKAQLHVKAALKKALKSFEDRYGADYTIDDGAILNAYPPENIK